MRPALAATAIVVASVGLTGVARAEEASPPTTIDVSVTVDREEVDVDTDDDDDSDKTGLWGLLGLLGLAGLAGLARRRTPDYTTGSTISGDTTARGSSTRNP